MSKTETPTAAFSLDVAEAAAITGRTTKQAGKYLVEVQGAIDAPDTAFGIRITEDNKDKTIVNQLQKSAAQLNVKLRIYSRPNFVNSQGEPAPFVGFQYKPLTTNPAEPTVDATSYGE